MHADCRHCLVLLYSFVVVAAHTRVQYIRADTLSYIMNAVIKMS